MSINKKITAFAVLLAVLTVMCVFAPYGSLSGAAAVPSDRPVLIPGGMAFGVKFFTRGVVVVGLNDVETATGLASPAKDAGFRTGDVILSVNGREVNTVEMLGSLINESRGKPLNVTYTRDGQERSAVLPAVQSSDGTYRSGLWVKDSTAGIGTITYIDAENDTFGGLGHGICDGETGELLPLLKAAVVDVRIDGIVKGRRNEPGELKGEFSSVKRGTLTENTFRGVFGTINTSGMELAEPMEICRREELVTGKAYVLTALDDVKPQLYEISIEKIFPLGEKTKNFIIKVTDERLIAKTGGVVQGMSGSPVIQNGRLAGAVTHVMINDPTSGYGIFIENMLDEAS